MDVQVPEGHCWLIGDNVDASRDSRFYGPLPLALIKGKVIARVLPIREEGVVQEYIKGGLSSALVIMCTNGRYSLD